MKVIILAAGYGTRLYPKTINTPKALLEYNGRSILDYILNDLNHFSINEIIIVTNNKFYNKFNEYINKRKENIKLINDGSNDNSNRLGALNDLKLGLNNIDDDVLVMASDNLLSFSINEFINFFNKDKISSIMYYKENDNNLLKKTGQGIIHKNRLIDFKEKPVEAISNYAIPPFYIFNKNDLNIIKNIDIGYESLGNVIEYICNKIHIKCYRMKGYRIDIGS